MPETAIDPYTEERLALELLLQEVAQETSATQVTELPPPADESFQDAVTKVQQEGGIEAHGNKYGGNPERCPFVKSLGSAGMELVNKWKASEKNHDRGPTMKELMAEKRAEREAAKNTTSKPDQIVEASSSEPLRPQAIQEQQTAILRNLESTLVFEEQVKYESKPQLAQSDLLIIQSTEESVRQADKATENLIATKEIIAIQKTAETPAILKAELSQTELATEPTATLTLRRAKKKVIVSDEVPTPLFKAKTVTNSANSENPLNEVQAMAILPILPKETTASEQLTHDEMGKTEDYDELVEELLIVPDVQILLEPAGQTDFIFQEVYYPQDETKENPVAESIGILSDQKIESVPNLSEEVKLKVFKTIEAISEICIRMKSIGEADLKPEQLTEQLEILCKELFEQIGFTPGALPVEVILQDIIEKLAIEDLNSQGTNEHKITFVTSLQSQFVKNVQQRAYRFVEISKYILVRMSGAFSTQVLAA